MEKSDGARAFLASLDETQLEVGDGSDGLPVWIGIDAEAGRVYKVFADGSALGFGDGMLEVRNGLHEGPGWRVSRGEQLSIAGRCMLNGHGGEGTRLYEQGASGRLLVLVAEHQRR